MVDRVFDFIQTHPRGRKNRQCPGDKNQIVAVTLHIIYSLSYAAKKNSGKMNFEIQQSRIETRINGYCRSSADFSDDILHILLFSNYPH